MSESTNTAVNPNGNVASAETAEQALLADSALAKARSTLIPFLFALYVVAYLDRINVAFAALEMDHELGISASAFGFGAGLFFLGYSIFEVPSNIILARVGARAWIARIMITWGLVAMAMTAVRGPASFFAMRFLLGVAEAGFFPGVIYYLTCWFPAHERARAVALFMSATALAGIVAGPASGALLAMHGALGLAGWQWLFLVEGLPAVILGIAVAFYLPNGPADAAWLEQGERDALANRLALEDAHLGPARHSGLRAALVSGRVWMFALVYFAIVLGLYGVSFWLPQIIRGLGVRSQFSVGLLAAIPFIFGAVGMVMVSRSSDRSGERRWHLAISAMVGAAGLVMATMVEMPALSMLALSIAAAGIWGTFGPFWAMPPEFLAGAASAGGIALINSVGNLGGFFGPSIIGIVREQSNGFGGGMLAMAASLVVGGLLALMLPRTNPAG